MSTATLTNLLEFLYGILTPSNQKWLGEHLIEHAESIEEPMRPYTMEEIDAMLEESERDFEAGRCYIRRLDSGFHSRHPRLDRSRQHVFVGIGAHLAIIRTFQGQILGMEVHISAKQLLVFGVFRIVLIACLAFLEACLLTDVHKKQRYA